MCSICVCMVKKSTTLTIDSDVLEEAKKNMINMSAVAEQALKKASGIKEVEINIEEKCCDFCQRELRKATAEDQNGLVWLWPHERWICPKCLRSQINTIIKGKNTY